MSTGPKLPKLNGWKRQAPDSKAKLFKGVQATLTEHASDVIDMRHWCSFVEDQRTLGSCVANAIVGALELLRIKNGLAHTELSRLFTYYNARLMHNDESTDSGSIISLAIGTLNTLGTCTEATWPYVEDLVCIRPAWHAYQEAYGNKVGNYELINGTGQARIDACINALRGGQPVVFGMDIDEAFTANKSPSLFFSGPNVGNHAMLMVGYLPAQKQFIVRNSWGTNWADAGYWYMDEQLLDKQNAADTWVLYETPQLLQKS